MCICIQMEGMYDGAEEYRRMKCFKPYVICTTYRYKIIPKFYLCFKRTNLQAQYFLFMFVMMKFLQEIGNIKSFFRYITLYC